MTTHETVDPAAQDSLPATAGAPNRLLRAAYPLLECLPRLRQRQHALDLPTLHAELAALIQAFSLETRADGLSEDTVAMSRYCLCALLDETIADTPWGSEAWAARSLLVTFHQETSGGERFFGILQWLAQNPEEHFETLEFLYVLLSLGMEGRYRLLEGGLDELARLRERLYQLLHNARGARETALSPDWRHTRLPREDHTGRRWTRGLALGLPIVLIGLYLGLDEHLATRARTALPAPVPVALRARGEMPANGAAAPQLARLLADAIHAQQLRLEVQPDRTILTLRVDSLFASGSATPLPSTLDLLHQVARALATVPGRIEVAGHSDNQPTAPGAVDNRRLSLERADAIARLLADGQVDRSRITTAGRGPDEPLLPNTTPANLARNRRVVITLFDTGAGT